MKNEFAPYDLALAMKELGFDEFTVAAYVDNELDIGGLWKDSVTSKVIHKAPTYSQAFRWFRVKGYHAGIIPRYDEFHYHIKDFNTDNEYDDVYNISSYEEAELACLRKLIEIVNQNKDDEK